VTGFLRYTPTFQWQYEPTRQERQLLDRLWKITAFDHLSYTYAKFYSPPQHVAVDEAVELIKGRAIFKQYIPKKHKCFDIKIYKLCDMIQLYIWYKHILGKWQAKCNTATHVTVRNLTRRLGVGHKLYMDNFFSCPDISNDLYTRGINCCWTVRQYHKEIPRGLKATKIEMGWCVQGWKVTSQQWLGKTSEMCTFWHICIDHQ